jgi:hypothetical protein
MAGETIILGKNVTYTGVTNVKEGSVTTTYTEIDKTKKGDLKRTYLKGWAEQTLQCTCVDVPGCDAGGSITVSTSNANGHALSAIKFLVTSVSQSEPLDDITTYTVSATRGPQ